MQLDQQTSCGQGARSKRREVARQGQSSTSIEDEDEDDWRWGADCVPSAHGDVGVLARFPWLRV
jgi:hypothetical protein